MASIVEGNRAGSATCGLAEGTAKKRFQNPWGRLPACRTVRQAGSLPHVFETASKPQAAKVISVR